MVYSCKHGQEFYCLKEKMVLLILLLAYVVWMFWFTRTYGNRSLAKMLKSWPHWSCEVGGHQLGGATSKLVFYSLMKDWGQHSADFKILAHDPRVGFFEVTVSVHAVRVVTQFVVTRVLTESEARAWLRMYQDDASVDRCVKGVL